MNTIRIIPAPFTGKPSYDIQAAPMLTPTGATFPDGETIHAYRVNARLVIGGTDSTAGALRFGNALYIFAEQGEEATAQATLRAAQVDTVIEIGANAAAYLSPKQEDTDR